MAEMSKDIKRGVAIAAGIASLAMPSCSTYGNRSHLASQSEAAGKRFSPIFAATEETLVFRKGADIDAGGKSPYIPGRMELVGGTFRVTYRDGFAYLRDAAGAAHYVASAYDLLERGWGYEDNSSVTISPSFANSFKPTNTNRNENVQWQDQGQNQGQTQGQTQSQWQDQNQAGHDDCRTQNQGSEQHQY